MFARGLEGVSEPDLPTSRGVGRRGLGVSRRGLGAIISRPLEEGLDPRKAKGPEWAVRADVPDSGPLESRP